MKRPVNLTMLTYGRPRLAQQAFRTLQENTNKDLYELSIFDDEAKLGTGPARNEVIRQSEHFFGRGEYLYLSDCDVAFTFGWLDTLIEAYEFAREHLQVGAIGGYCHPYHQPIERHAFNDREIGITWSLPTQSMLMSWDIWDRFGPFSQTSPGKVQQGEDWLFTERLRAAGLRVASLYPPVVYNTAKHDSFGNLMVGHELVEDIEGLLIE